LHRQAAFLNLGNTIRQLSPENRTPKRRFAKGYNWVDMTGPGYF